MIGFLILAAASAADAPPESRHFGDFEVGCDNHRDCQAVGYAPEPPSDTKPMGVGLIVARKAAADALPKANIDNWDRTDFTGSILVDGADTGVRSDKAGNLSGDIVALLRRLATATSAGLGDKDGKVIAPIATKGASAALRWIDEQQQRSGTATALVASGERPATAIPPPPPLPRIETPPPSKAKSRTLTKAQVAALQEPYECDKDVAAGDPDYARLDARNSLAILPCWRGAYQADGIIVIVPDQGPPAIATMDSAVAVAGPRAAQDVSRLITPEYRASDGLLWEEYRGRGLSDCGHKAAWAWDGQGFRLAYVAALDECRGARTRITLWQTANRPDD